MKKFIFFAIFFITTGIILDTGTIAQAKINGSAGMEVRWFYEGSVADPVYEWFLENKRLGNMMTEKEGKHRVDLYLIAEGAPFLGVKLRGGKLEIKYRIQKEDISIKDGLGGKREVWIKWEWKYSERKDSPDDMVSAFMKNTDVKSYANVEKTRWQRKFLMEENGNLTPVSIKKCLYFGVMAEITEVKVGQNEWWTLAIETFGEADEPVKAFAHGLNWILEDYPGPLPLMKNSMSYPEWLLNSMSALDVFTHIVSQSTAYYLTSPAQGQPSEGEFPAGTKVKVLQESGSYSLVQSYKKIKAYVANETLKTIIEP